MAHSLSLTAVLITLLVTSAGRAESDGIAAPRPTDGAATQPLEKTVLYVSGTMHIETNVGSWPEPERLIEFFRRATAAGKSEAQPKGMHWSIGADIGWLQREPRAAEVVKALEALGVEWDIHAHHVEDRPTVAATITRFGGHPNRVASGLLLNEFDNARKPFVDRDGNSWQAEVIWGLALRPLHGPGADDFAAGLWRPKDAAHWAEHDPAGNLIVVGGGSRKMADIERYAMALNADGGTPRVLSSSIIMSPRRLTVTGTTEGIDAIETWAARMAGIFVVRWANIRETAEAWKAAGGSSTREEK